MNPHQPTIKIKLNRQTTTKNPNTPKTLTHNITNITHNNTYKLLHKKSTNPHSSGTLKFWDNTSAATTVIFNTITLAAGERYIDLGDVAFNTGLYLTIGGTADVTVVYR